jgi:ABC-type glycerol-3-phosphate transport system permease component
VAVVAFPLYMTFVASTHTVSDIVQAPMPMLPGSHMVENYTAAWNGTGGGNGSKAPVGQMMMVSLVSALIIAWARSPSRCCRHLPSCISGFRSGCSSSGPSSSR